MVWGTTWFAIRVCIGEGGYPTMPAAALRFTVAAMALGSVVALARPEPRIEGRRQWVWLGIAGLLNGLGYALVYFGEETVSGAFAAILFGTIPLVTAFLAVLTRTERVSLGHFIGAFTSLGGIVLIFQDRLSVSGDQAVGIGLLCAGVLVSSIYSVILKREGLGVHPFRSTFYFLLVTSVALWAATVVRGDAGDIPWPPPVKPTLALFYLALFGSVLTFASYLYLLQRVSLMTTTTLVFIQPLIALTVDMIWEPELQLSTLSYLGAGVTMLGVLISVLWKELARRARPA